MKQRLCFLDKKPKKNFTQGIPQAGETVVIGNYQIEIIEVSNTKIDLVCVKMCNPDT